MASIKRFHPGVYLKELLDSMEMTAKEFSLRTGISERTISALITGNGDLTFDIAYKLSIFFDNSINYWTNLQTQYNVYLKELNKNEELKKEWVFASKVKNYLIDYGYVFNNFTKEEIINKCREVVGVNSLMLLDKKDLFVCLKEHHTKKEVDYFAQNFWIALALNEARKKNEIPFNKNMLIEYIPEIRGMTKQNLEDFLPRLKYILNECGISFVLLPYLSKSYIYGATKWFSKDNVMLAISNRGEKADLFWFILFHEISHVLMEHRRETLINIENDEDDEADLMAAEMLISNDKWNDYINKNCFTEDSIIEFANSVGIHPCIVLGRLHKEKKYLVPYGKFDKKFKTSYKFKTSDY